MNKDEVWGMLAKKRPVLNDPKGKIEFAVENLRTLLDQVWEQGAKHTADGQKPRDTVGKGGSFGSNPMGQIFDDMFGGCKK